MKRIDNVSIMGSGEVRYLSFTMSEIAEDGTIIKSGIRKSKQLVSTDIEFLQAIDTIKSKLETEENA